MQKKGGAEHAVNITKCCSLDLAVERERTRQEILGTASETQVTESGQKVFLGQKVHLTFWDVGLTE